MLYWMTMTKCLRNTMILTWTYFLEITVFKIIRGVVIKLLKIMNLYKRHAMILLIKNITD
jgi:hypothetical protein